MANLIDSSAAEEPEKAKRSPRSGPRTKASPPESPHPSAESVSAEAGENEGEAVEFDNIEHLQKKGLRVLPVVTGAVVDASGNFLFYVDGHEDSRSAVQAQVNYLLRSGPSRAEHLAKARARAAYLADVLSRPR